MAPDDGRHSRDRDQKDLSRTDQYQSEWRRSADGYLYPRWIPAKRPRLYRVTSAVSESGRAHERLTTTAGNNTSATADEDSVSEDWVQDRLGQDTKAATDPGHGYRPDC